MGAGAGELARRLELVEGALAVGDADVAVLLGERLPGEAAVLAGLLRDGEFGRAAVWIADYRRAPLMPRVWVEPRVAGLRLELEALEIELACAAGDKADRERQIGAFLARSLEVFGDVMVEVLRLQAARAEAAALEEAGEGEAGRRAEAEAARAAWEEFGREREAAPAVAALGEEEMVELRDLYRRAAMRCHPDRLDEARRAGGTAIFQELEAAYRAHDLAAVRDVWGRVRRGEWGAASAALARVGDVAALEARVARVRAQLAAVRAEMAALEADESWMTIVRLREEGREWEAYFWEVREGLEGELARLRGEG